MHELFWLSNVKIPFKTKTIEKPYKLLLPDFWFLSCNKKFNDIRWVGALQKLTLW